MPEHTSTNKFFNLSLTGSATAGTLGIYTESDGYSHLNEQSAYLHALSASCFKHIYSLQLFCNLQISEMVRQDFGFGDLKFLNLDPSVWVTVVQLNCCIVFFIQSQLSSASATMATRSASSQCD